MTQKIGKFNFIDSTSNIILIERRVAGLGDALARVVIHEVVVEVTLVGVEVLVKGVRPVAHGSGNADGGADELVGGVLQGVPLER